MQKGTLHLKLSPAMQSGLWYDRVCPWKSSTQPALAKSGLDLCALLPKYRTPCDVQQLSGFINFPKMVPLHATLAAGLKK